MTAGQAHDVGECREHSTVEVFDAHAEARHAFFPPRNVLRQLW